MEWVQLMTPQAARFACEVWQSALETLKPRFTWGLSMASDAVWTLFCRPKIAPPRPSHHFKKVLFSIDLHPYHMRPPLKQRSA